MLELFVSLLLQVSVALGGNTSATSVSQFSPTQTSIQSVKTTVPTSSKASTTPSIGGGGWDDKN